MLFYKMEADILRLVPVKAAVLAEHIATHGVVATRQYLIDHVDHKDVIDVRNVVYALRCSVNGDTGFSEHCTFDLPYAVIAVLNSLAALLTIDYPVIVDTYHNATVTHLKYTWPGKTKTYTMHTFKVYVNQQVVATLDSYAICRHKGRYQRHCPQSCVKGMSVDMLKAIIPKHNYGSLLLLNIARYTSQHDYAYLHLCPDSVSLYTYYANRGFVGDPNMDTYMLGEPTLVYDRCHSILY